MPTPDKLQDDPHVKLPAAVLAASARSLELQNSLNAPAEVTTDSNEEPVDPSVDPANLASAPTNPAPRQEPDTASDEEDWEHKYNSLMGRFKALEKSNNALETRLIGMQGVLAAMQTAPVPANPAPIAEQRFVTDEEENDYGKDLLDVVGRRAKQILSPEIEEMRRKIEEQGETIKRLNGKSAQSDQDKLLGQLASEVPDWQNINRDQNFIAWLALPDPFSGAIRQELLNTAFSQGQAPRVIAFFKGFLAEEAATKPAPRTEPDPATTVVTKVPLAELAAPGRAKAPGAPPAPVDKPRISRAQIAQYYADVAAGRYKGRDELQKAHELMIFDAQRDGRITD